MKHFFPPVSLYGKMNRALLIALLSILPAALQAESDTPSLGFAGVHTSLPVDHAGQDCTTCHTSFAPANSDTNGSLTVQVSDYVPGTPQTIRIFVQHLLARQYGFQITIRQINDETVTAGTFTPQTPPDVPAAVQVACDNGTQYGFQGPCSPTTVQFAEHKMAPHGFQGMPFEFDVLWNPPEFEVGRLHVYVAAVAADGDGTPLGDRVYTSVTTIANAGSCGLTLRPITGNVKNAASLLDPISSLALVSITGRNFEAQNLTRTAGFGDFVNLTYPTELGCISVQVTGPGIPQPVLIPLIHVQQDRIDAQLPEFSGTGQVTLRVMLNPGQGNEIDGDIITPDAFQPFAPAWYLFANSTSIIAVFAGTGNLVANPSVAQGGQPAQPGNMISLFGTGFGDTNPATVVGQITTAPSQLTNNFTITIGTTTLDPSAISYAGMVQGAISGLYRFDVQIPLSTPPGDIPVTLSIGGFQTQPGTIPVVPVQQ